MPSLREGIDAVYDLLRVTERDLRTKIQLDEDAALRAIVKAAKTRDTAEEDIVWVKERAEDVSDEIKGGGMTSVPDGPLSFPVAIDTDLTGLPPSMANHNEATRFAGSRHEHAWRQEIQEDLLKLAAKIKLSPAQLDATIVERRRAARSRRRKLVRDERGLWLLVEKAPAEVDTSDDEGHIAFLRQEALARTPPGPRLNKFSKLDRLAETFRHEQAQYYRNIMDEVRDMEDGDEAGDDGDDEDEDMEDAVVKEEE